MNLEAGKVHERGEAEQKWFERWSKEHEGESSSAIGYDSADRGFEGDSRALTAKNEWQENAHYLGGVTWYETERWVATGHGYTTRV